MVVFSPKLEILNHFDELINRVDIDIETALETHKESQLLGDLECFEVEKRTFGIEFDSKYKLVFSDSFKPPKCEDLWSESTKVLEYLNQVRIRTIESLRKAQEDSLENSANFRHLRVEIEDKESLKSQLFATNFYFQIKLSSKKYISWIFNLYTIATDFYLSQSDIDLLQ